MQEDVTRPVVGGHEAERLLLVEPQDGAVGAVAGRDQRAPADPGVEAQRHHVLGLRPLLPRDDDEGHPLPGREDAPGDDGGGVHEHLRTSAVRRGEPVALGRLVPGDGREHTQGRVGRDVPGDGDAQRLRTAGSLTGLELHRLALAQRPGRALALHLRDVHEDVGAAVIRGEEAEAALEVVPADGSLLHSALLVSRMVRGPVSQAPYVHTDPDARQLRREYLAEVTEFTRRHQPLPEYADVRGVKTIPGGLTCASGRRRFVLVDQAAGRGGVR